MKLFAWLSFLSFVYKKGVFWLAGGHIFKGTIIIYGAATPTREKVRIRACLKNSPDLEKCINYGENHQHPSPKFEMGKAWPFTLKCMRIPEVFIRNFGPLLNLYKKIHGRFNFWPFMQFAKIINITN